MNKQAINPVTIRSQIPGQPELVVGRLAFGMGSVEDALRNMTVQVCIVPVGTTHEDIHERAQVVVVPQEQFVEALGHLFPGGELAKAHEVTVVRHRAVDLAKANPASELILQGHGGTSQLGVGTLMVGTGEVTVEIRPTYFGEETRRWAPTGEQRAAIEALAFPGRVSLRVVLDGDPDPDEALHFVEATFASLDEAVLQLPGLSVRIEAICRPAGGPARSQPPGPASAPSPEGVTGSRKKTPLWVFWKHKASRPQQDVGRRLCFLKAAAALVSAAPKC
jgi:hypothetical protein